MEPARLGTEVKMARAAIDIGSNSLLLAVVDDAGKLLEDHARVVGLGRGLGDRGLFQPERMKEAEKVFAEFVAIAKQHNIPSHAIKTAATSGARRAMNARTWFTRVRTKFGLRIQTISGEEEARLTWLGASRGLNIPTGPKLVVDLGGGSTELVLGEDDDVHLRVSLEVGSVRLTESFMNSEVYTHNDLSKMKNHIDTHLASLSFNPLPETVIGVAGTVTSLCAMQLGLNTFDSSKIHGAPLTREHLSQFEHIFLGTNPEQRQALAAVSPKRADYLLAGVAILERILSRSRSTQLTTSTGGLRFGLLH